MDRKGKGVIKVDRVSELFFNLEPINIYIDGRRVGKVLSGDFKEISVSSGRHKIFVRAEIVLYGTFSSNILQIEVQEGEIVDLECGSNYQGLKVVISKLCFLYKNDTFYIREAHA